MKSKMHTSFYKIVLYNYKTYAHKRKNYCPIIMALDHKLHEFLAATTENQVVVVRVSSRVTQGCNCKQNLNWKAILWQWLLTSEEATQQIATEKYNKLQNTTQDFHIEIQTRRIPPVSSDIPAWQKQITHVVNRVHLPHTQQNQDTLVTKQTNYGL